ncbi:hypothetical protein MNBD_GAMMA11-1630 [hydrothermal vent metagenome]|uniref:Cytochrome c domain-containing protein n=1 Tax=hydrothermal vent metagenome TaxID=652676 RepID=A0A3B0X108_9ZZZZ
MFIHNRIKTLMMLLAVCMLSVTSNSFAMKSDKGADKYEFEKEFEFEDKKWIVIKAKVYADKGGVFVDDKYSPNIEVTIPAGALEYDAVLKVAKIKYKKKYKSSAASPAYKVVLLTKKKGKKWVPVNILKPIEVAITANPLPVHPQIGELERFVGKSWKKGEWQRMMTNFYRPSTGMVVSLTKQAVIKLRVQHRTLKTVSGPAVARGEDLYFNETWGAEKMWTGRFRMNELLNVVAPATAVSLGVQVDIRKVPQPIIDVLVSDDFAAKQAALQDPALTRALIKADAVVGVRGKFNDPDDPTLITEVGLTCALCHVTVTKTPIQLEAGADPVPMPFGVPVLGPPNTTMNAGMILSFTPYVQEETPELIPQYQAWGPGRFDPRFFEGNPVNDNVFNPSSIPPHWNFTDLADQNYTVPWIGVLQTRSDNHSLASGPECGIDLVLGANGAWMTDNASVQDIELGNPLPIEFQERLILAEQTEPGNDIDVNDLLDVEAFLKSIVSPAPHDFDEKMAEEGWKLFYGKANCVACHSTPEGTGSAGYFTNIVENPPQGLLAMGIKTPGLRGLPHTAPYFHDGSAATLLDVMVRYTSPEIPEVPSDLTEDQLLALVEYMKSL